jgi:hypothetical protein
MRLLPLNVFLQETVAFILDTCTRVDEINATFLSSSRALRASVQTLFPVLSVSPRL